MFSAAMLYACPNLEMSIYSTCKVLLFGGVITVYFWYIHPLFGAEDLAKALAQYPEIPGVDLS